MYDGIPKEVKELYNKKNRIDAESKELIIDMCQILVDKRRDELEKASSPQEVFTMQGKIKELRNIIEFMRKKD